MARSLTAFAEAPAVRTYEEILGTVSATPDVVRPLELRTPTSTPSVRSTTTRDRDFYVEAGLVGGNATITVSRESPDDVGFREIFVSVDGEQIAILRHGESVSHEVVAGPHRLRAHNTLFWKTHEITMKPGEHVRFTAINRAGFGTFGLLFIIGAMPVYLTFERTGGTRGAPGSGDG